MEAEFKRMIFIDEWIRLSPFWKMSAPYEFPNYLMGWRLIPTDRELKLIQAHSMYGHTAVTLRELCIAFAFVLGPEFIPEVNRSPDALLQVEGIVLSAAARWTHFFESMDEPNY